MDPKILQISIYYCFATQKFFSEKKNHNFFKIPLWVFKILKISKIEKKVKIDNFFSDDAYRWAFFSKSAFFDLFAWKMLKKGSKNKESIGYSQRFLSIFAIFEKLPIYYCFPSQIFFQLQNNNKWGFLRIFGLRKSVSFCYL